MFSLNVFIEIRGIQTKVGNLICENNEAEFIYDADYLSSEYARPISVSLPLGKKSFSHEETRTYFESLLPEGFSRKSVAGWAHVDEGDYISLLMNLGRECIGAIQITEESETIEGGYKPLSDQDLRSLAREGAVKSTELLMESHISLAGASGKVGLYYNRENNTWYQPYGIAASTHIVKQSHVRLDNLVLNERLCMLTASKLNIDVPKSFIINMGTGSDEEMLYAVERYDRVISDADNALKTPIRLHQEDFAQALGIPASKKYENENRNYLKSVFELINNYSTNPIEDGLKLWDRIIFNYLIGNTDAHIKNYALLYSDDLSSIRLAPAYNMICTSIYGSRNDMSIMINGEIDCTKLTRESFSLAAKSTHIGQKIAMEHYDYLKNNLENALKEAATELKAEGYENAIELSKRIISKTKGEQLQRQRMKSLGL